MPPREALQRIKAATVAIAKWKGERRHPFSIVGSGFCIDPSGLVVTCRHVFDAFLEKPTLELIGSATGEIRPDGGQLLPPVRFEDMYAVFYAMRSETELAVLLAHVTHVVSRTDHDLALLKVNPEQPAFPTGYPIVELAEPEEVNEGDEVGTCGFPLGERLHDELGTVTSSFTKGIVSSIVPGPGIPSRLIRAFQLDVGAAPGNSGGPAFLWDTGRVFGALEVGLAHLIRAVALHHLLVGDTLEALRQAKVGELPIEGQ